MFDSALRLSPTTCAVVVVDVQNDFCRPDGALAQSGCDTSAVMEMVPRLRRLLVEARRIGSRIIFVRTTHDEDVDSQTWLRRHGTALTVTRMTTCRTGSWGADFYGVVPEPGESIVTKHRYSAFVGTSLDGMLRSAGVTSLLFTGVATEVCVDSSLRDGLFHDFDVTLIEDCCASYYPDCHAATVDTVRRNFGPVTTGGEVSSFWGSLTENSRADARGGGVASM